MLALELDTSAVKGFMGALLRGDIFDNFEARNLELLTNMRISIDSQSETGFMQWRDMRPLIYNIIKEGQKPRYIKIVFSLVDSDIQSIHQNAAALFLNLVYENDSVTFTTATAQKEFVMDKSLDFAWDDWINGFFAKNALPVLDKLM